MTITRVVHIDDIGDIAVAMSKAPEVFRDAVRLDLYNVMTSRPKTAMLKRTPVATTRRYQIYKRKDGKITQLRYRGTVGSMHRSAENGVRVNGDVLEFGVRATSNLTYAQYVHERTVPGEGEYWSEGSHGLGRGWTTKGTGNKFVQRPVEEYADYIPEALTKLIDKRLSEAGA